MLENLKSFKNLIRKKEKVAAEDAPAEKIKENKKNDSSPYPDLPGRYSLLERIGDGAFSTVFRAHDKELDIDVAIKIIDKTELTKSQMDVVLKEVAIMRRLDHPNVVKMYNYINTETVCFIIMEYVSGGELFNQIVKLTYFSEDLSRHVIIQVVKAIDYLHSEVGVVHRDIKPENLFFEKIPLFPREAGSSVHRRASDDSSKVDEGGFVQNVGGGTVGRVKLGDFGLSKVLWDSNTKTPCGTASYTAPEIVKDESYSKSVDMWAIGCVLYTMLCGFPPFYDSDPKTLTLKVSRGEYTFLSPWWDEISKEAKDLVSHLLTVDPTKRYGPEEVLNDPWILKNSRPTTPALDAPVYQTKSESILRFEQVIPQESSGVLSPRAEALKFAFDKGISIQRTATPLRRLLEEDDYFDESDDDEDDDDDDDEDTTNNDNDKTKHNNNEDDEDDDDDDSGSDVYVCAKSPVMRKFPHHSTPLPLTPYVTMKRKKNSTIVVENEVVSEQDALKQSRDLSPSCFKQVDTTFHLNFDGNTLLNRRKMSGGFACGPKT